MPAKDMSTLIANLFPCVEKLRDKLGYQVFLLATSTGIATLFLLLTNLVTSPAIAMRAQEDQLAGLAQVMPPTLYKNDILSTRQQLSVQGQQYQIFTAEAEPGVITGYVLETEAPGYAGPIRLIIGVAIDGSLIGVRVLSHSETPGLGDKIEVAKSDWIRSFDGHSLDNTSAPDWAVKKDGGSFDQFSGATITPRAIVTSVHKSLQDLSEAIQALAKPEPQETLTTAPITPTQPAERTVPTLQEASS
ncbi:electron transport complex subunit RsxG [Corallincola platygyrae]|uniref:Ion-translocating oxidoreductase complex subunit G n=1 Tax=Corallincola platygyrae TaxID=1193278 RepID=A0ABW4XIC0_9GAMM